MHIYLMRHAEAVDPAGWTGPDKARPLSHAGLSGLENAVKGMQRRRLTADTLLTSPYERASRTAQILAAELHILQTRACPELAAGARPENLSRLVGENTDAETLWLVGHMPDLALFAARLTGDRSQADAGFGPGDMLAVDCPVDGAGPRPGTALWRRRLSEWTAD